MKFFTMFNLPKDVHTVPDLETLYVDQSEAKMSSLSYQIERYGMDGLMARFEAMKDKFGYADVRNIPSFEELHNRIVKGIEYFNNLPSQMRAQFGNSPESFYSYIQNNPEEAVEKGYISGLDKSYLDFKLSK